MWPDILRFVHFLRKKVIDKKFDSVSALHILLSFSELCVLIRPLSDSQNHRNDRFKSTWWVLARIACSDICFFLGLLFYNIPSYLLWIIDEEAPIFMGVCMCVWPQLMVLCSLFFSFSHFHAVWCIRGQMVKCKCSCLNRRLQDVCFVWWRRYVGLASWNLKLGTCKATGGCCRHDKDGAQVWRGRWSYEWAWIKWCWLLSDIKLMDSMRRGGALGG